MTNPRDTYEGDERSGHARAYDDETLHRVNRLWQTVYGVVEEEGSGIVRKINHLDQRLNEFEKRFDEKTNRLYLALAGASLTALGSAVTIVIASVA